MYMLNDTKNINKTQGTHAISGILQTLGERGI